MAAAVGLIAAFAIRGLIIRTTAATSTYGTPQLTLFDGWDWIPDAFAVFMGRVGTETLALVALPLIAIALPASRRALWNMRSATGFGLVLYILILGYTTVSSARSGVPRPDFLYYTRYQGPGSVVIACLAATNIAGVGSRTSIVSLRLNISVVASLALAALTVFLLADPTVFQVSPVWANVPELAALGSLRPGPVFLLVIGVTCLLLLIGQLLKERSYVLVACLMAGLGISAAWFIGTAYPASAGRAVERDLVPYFSVLEDTDCVLYDPSSFSFWNRANYEFFSDARFVPTGSSDADDCGPLFLAGDGTTLEMSSNAVLLDREPVPDLNLYLLSSGDFDLQSYQLTETDVWYRLDGEATNPQAVPQNGVVFMSGWQAQADTEDFRWSDETKSTLHIQLAEDLVGDDEQRTEISLDLVPFLVPDSRLTEQLVTVQVNGRRHANLPVSRSGVYSIRLDASELSTSLTIDFSYPDASRPCDHDLSADCRVLAIAVVGVMVRRVGA